MRMPLAGKDIVFLQARLMLGDLFFFFLYFNKCDRTVYLPEMRYKSKPHCWLLIEFKFCSCSSRI